MDRKFLYVGGAVALGAVAFFAMRSGAAGASPALARMPAQQITMRPIGATDLPPPLTYNLPPFPGGTGTGNGQAPASAYGFGEQPCGCSGSYGANLTSGLNDSLKRLGDKVNSYISDYEANILSALPDYWRNQINNGVAVALNTNATKSLMSMGQFF